MTRTAIVYGLFSTRDFECRYIGQTTRSVRERLAQHKSYAKTKRTAVHRWFSREIAQGFDVLLVPLVSNAVWNDTERDLLADCRAAGMRLLNLTDGGEGTPGLRLLGRKRPDLAERNRLSAGRPGHKHTEEAKARMSAIHQGKKCPWNVERNKAQAGKAGHPHTDEHKQRMRELMTGREVTWGAKVSAAKKGKTKLSGEQIAKLRAGHRAYFERKRNAEAPV